LIDRERRIDALGQFHVVDPAHPVLSRDDEHHLRRVLRATVGEEIVVTDGAGSYAFATVGERDIVRVSDVATDPTPTSLTLYLAPLKGDRSEWALAKAVELGVTTVVPLVSSRLAIKFTGDARDKTVRRWRRVAREAAGQCRRSHDLVVADPVTLADLPSNVVVATLRATAPLLGATAVAIGPEGGFSGEELGDRRLEGSLGPQVLRAETAAVVAATLMASATWPGFSSVHHGGGAVGDDRGRDE
jgi:16S rRNA (uracil1498-N3)-methyltransferase